MSRNSMITHNGQLYHAHRMEDVLDDPDLSVHFIRAYQDVFSAEPWYEQYRCVACVHNQGQDLQYPYYLAGSCIRLLPPDGICPACGNRLQPFWPGERVLADMKHQLKQPSASGTVLALGEQIVGFCLGFCMDPDLLEKHLKLPGLVRQIQVVRDLHNIAYLSDIAVIPSHRRRGLAKVLFNIRNDSMAHSRPDALVFRSRPDAITYKWYTREFGFTVIDRYNRVFDSDVREVLILPNPPLN